MGEVTVDVEFRYAPGLVWTALTRPALLRQWFTEVDLQPGAGQRFRVPAAGLPGLPGPVDGRIAEADEPRRLVLLWPVDGRETRLSFELTPTPTGCRIRLRHAGLADRGDVDLLPRLQEAYRIALGKRLPALLDRLAGPAYDDRPTALLPLVPATGRPSGRWPARLLLASVPALVLLLLVAGLVVLLRPGPAPPVVAPPPARPVVGPAQAEATASATAPSRPARRAERASRSSSPRPRSPSPSATTGAPARSLPTGLVARYATLEARPDLHRAEIGITNRGPAGASGWRVVLTLPAGARVVGVEQAVADQAGDTVTVTPSGPVELPAGTTSTFTVTIVPVPGGSEPRPVSCRIGDRPCEGL